MQFHIDPKDLKKLEEQFQDIGDAIVKTIEDEMADLAMSLYIRAQAMAEERLNGEALEQFLDALSIDEDSSGDIISFTIRLAGPALKYEDGFPSYDMKPGLLSGPKSQLSIEGNRYNTVPFDHAVKTGVTPTIKRAKTSVEKAIKMYGLDEIIRDSNNKILQGKVGVINDKRFGKNLMGLTKYQTKVNNKKVESSFVTFRRVSDASSPSSWIHPGSKGVKIFDDLSDLAEEEIDDMIKNFLK